MKNDTKMRSKVRQNKKHKKENKVQMTKKLKMIKTMI